MELRPLGNVMSNVSNIPYLLVIYCVTQTMTQWLN